MAGADHRAAALISADWGTTALRLYLLARDGTILEQRSSGDGMSSVPAGGFDGVLTKACGEWLAANSQLPVLLSGMVGSRQGWVEAPYATCPAGLPELASRLISLDVPRFKSVHIVPGITCTDAAGIPDVMRGEECQIMGALALMGLTDATFVMPGTHSKWVTVAGGQIAGFRTFMTGEIFAALKGHTILGRMMSPGTAGRTIEGNAAFARGVETAGGSVAPGEWLHRLFSVRTLGLMGKLSDADSSDYLSGLMIGWELASYQRKPGEKLVVVGSRELTERYRAAAALVGLEMVQAPQDCVCAGHVQIARTAGLLVATT